MKHRPDSHSFRGVKYRVRWRKPKGYPSSTGGTCDHPGKKNAEIEIHPSERGKNKLRILIDESIHACVWDLDNESVGEISVSISEFLWRCGLRFCDEK